jgi:hypothetical protein
MTYYDVEVNRFCVTSPAGKKTWKWMTEEQVEAFQEKFPTWDVQFEAERNGTLPDEAADDYLDCTCPDEPPDGNMTGKLCKHCELFFKELEV